MLTYANLLSLGNCFASSVPVSFLKKISTSDFMNFYTNVGKTMQPNPTEATEISTKLTQASADVNKEEFVFTTASSLAVFYPSFASLNAVIFIIQ